MTATETRTMTASQMAWNLKKGFAWEEAEGEWTLPIWTNAGGWVWDVDAQLYRLELA